MVGSVHGKIQTCIIRIPLAACLTTFSNPPMLKPRPRSAFYTIILLLMFILPGSVLAQGFSPRVGVGLSAMMSWTGELNFGPGIRLRIAQPLNQDLSLAGDVGIAGFVLGGRDDASYVFNPQVSAIITLPEPGNTAPYLLFGLGLYLSSDDLDSDGEPLTEGPFIHAGYGLVQQLNETTLFFEVNPGLIIGRETIGLMLPVRAGVIF